MDTKREHNILLALSRAVEVEEDLTLRRVLSELIIERYPESIYGWAYSAKNDPLKLNNTDALRKKLSDMHLSLKALASSKEKGVEVDRSIFAWASDICADIFADREDFKAVIEVLEKVPEVAPQKHASVRWKIVAALIALNRTSEARQLASEKSGESVFPLGDFANHALLEALAATNDQERLAAIARIDKRNSYLAEFLRSEKRVPATLPKRPKRVYQGSRYEALLYLRYALQAWISSTDILIALLGGRAATRSESAVPDPRLFDTAPIALKKEPPSIESFRTSVANFNFVDVGSRRAMELVQHPKLWAQFFALAEKWLQARVWETVGREEMFQLNLATLGERFRRDGPAVVSTMGALGECFGIHLMDSENDQMLIEKVEGGSKLDQMLSARQFSSVTFDFVDPVQVSEENRCLHQVLGIEPMGPKKVVPNVLRIRAGLMPTLPVEGRLLELMAAMENTLFFHEGLKVGASPWKSVPKGMGFVSSMPCPNLSEWAGLVQISEPAPHPHGAEQKINQVELIETLSAATQGKGEWEIAWAYAGGYVGGEGCLAYSPTVLVVVDRSSRYILAAQSGAYGESLVGLLARALKEGVLSVGHKPRSIVVTSSIPCAVIEPLLRSVGITVLQNKKTSVANRVLMEMIDIAMPSASDMV